MKLSAGRYIVTSILLISGCAALSTGAGGLTAEDVVGELQAEGIDLVEGDRAMHSSLSVPGYTFSVAGGELQIYEYKSESSASLDASRIRRGSGEVTSAPHFYHRENILAIYTGNDLVVLSALNDLLGGQIR